MSIRCFQHNNVEVRVVAHQAKGKIDMVIMSHCSPIDRMTDGEAMLVVVESACIGMTSSQFAAYVPDWTKIV